MPNFSPTNNLFSFTTKEFPPTGGNWYQNVGENWGQFPPNGGNSDASRRFFLPLVKIIIMENESKGMTLGKGCLIVLLLIGGFIFYKVFINGSKEPNACFASETFIKSDLKFPKEAELPFLECHVTEKDSDTYTVLRKVTAVNAFGVEQDYIYKVKLRFLGGDELEKGNWELISLRKEVYID